MYSLITALLMMTSCQQQQHGSAQSETRLVLCVLLFHSLRYQILCWTYPPPCSSQLTSVLKNPSAGLLFPAYVFAFYLSVCVCLTILHLPDRHINTRFHWSWITHITKDMRSRLWQITEAKRSCFMYFIWILNRTEDYISAFKVGYRQSKKMTASQGIVSG